MAIIRRGNYFHDTNDFGPKILQGGAMLGRMLAIAEEAAVIARATAKEDTGTWKESFRASAEIEDHKGLRAVGILRSEDPDAVVKEFGRGSTRTMNDAMSQAAGT